MLNLIVRLRDRIAAARNTAAKQREILDAAFPPVPNMRRWD